MTRYRPALVFAYGEPTAVMIADPDGAYVLAEVRREMELTTEEKWEEIRKVFPDAIISVEKKYGLWSISYANTRFLYNSKAFAIADAYSILLNPEAAPASEPVAEVQTGCDSIGPSGYPCRHAKGHTRSHDDGHSSWPTDEHVAWQKKRSILEVNDADLDTLLSMLPGVGSLVDRVRNLAAALSRQVPVEGERPASPSASGDAKETKLTVCACGELIFYTLSGWRRCGSDELIPNCRAWDDKQHRPVPYQVAAQPSQAAAGSGEEGVRMQPTQRKIYENIASIHPEGRTECESFAKWASDAASDLERKLAIMTADRDLWRDQHGEFRKALEKMERIVTELYHGDVEPDDEHVEEYRAVWNATMHARDLLTRTQREDTK